MEWGRAFSWGVCGADAQTWPAVSAAPGRVGCTGRRNRPERPQTLPGFACGWSGKTIARAKHGLTQQWQSLRKLACNRTEVIVHKTSTFVWKKKILSDQCTGFTPRVIMHASLSHQHNVQTHTWVLLIPSAACLVISDWRSNRLWQILNSISACRKKKILLIMSFLLLKKKKTKQ